MVKITFLPSLAGFALASQYINWSTFKGNGVNLGGWMEQEKSIDPDWWNHHSGGASDEWGLCANLGSQCGPVLEERFASFFTTCDIDLLAQGGVNVFRIPTTYAAWIQLPGSQLYSGNQASYISDIATYAIEEYGMHVVLDLHSLPGGVNGLDIGEAQGHYGWFHNETALDYSMQAVDAVLDFIQTSGHPESYTLAPINEPADVHDFSVFGTPACLTDDGAAWVLKYIHKVLAKVQSTNPQIPVLFQGSFKNEEYWSPNFPADSNLVFDRHTYYFAHRSASAANLTSYFCEDSPSFAGDGKFPVFIGEWDIVAQYNNTHESRKKNLQSGIQVWAKYNSGSAYWNAKYLGQLPVAGEGTNEDYWNYETLIQLGYTDSFDAAVDC